MLQRSAVVAVAAGVGLVLADVAIVVLALPELLATLHTSIVGVAAILFAYLAVLAVAAPLAAWSGARSPGSLAAAGFAVAAAASVAAALATTLPVLLAARVLGAAGAGCAVAGAFSVIDGAGSGRAVWQLVSLGGIALGPALGGVLTQAFSWRATFAVQVPVLLLAALLAARSARSTVAALWLPRPRLDAPVRWQLVLALLSASLTGALFLLVLVLVAGWNLSPLAAALTVSVLPAAAGLASRVRAPARGRVVAGCLLTGSGTLALAFLPGVGPGWTIAPQLLVGAGAGMALPALSSELLPERTTFEAVRQLTIRSAGIAVFLALVAPVVATRLQSGIRQAELQGIALVLDAPLSPQSKFSVAPRLFASLRSQDVRASLDHALSQGRSRFQGGELAAYDRLGTRGDQLVTGVVQGSFAPAFVLAGALALLAAALGLGRRPGGGLGRKPGGGLGRRPGGGLGRRPGGGLGRRPGGGLGRRPPRALAAGALSALSVAVPVAYVVLRSANAPPPVRIASPCRGGPLPSSGGISGFLQDRAIELLDTAACHLHTTREELVLAAADPAEGARFAASHDGIDPHSIIAPVVSLLGSL